MTSTLLFLSASEISIIVGVLAIITGAGIGALAFRLIDKKRIDGNKIKATQILEQADLDAKNTNEYYFVVNDVEFSLDRMKAYCYNWRRINRM